MPKDAILFIDESHVTVPQIRGMYNGDRARKMNLVDFGFRLPSALDNRPLKFEEFEKKVNQVIYVSATPGDYELELTNNKYIEQIASARQIELSETQALPLQLPDEDSTGEKTYKKL